MPQPEDPIIYHKDLRPVEVCGRRHGRSAALHRIYGMLAIDDKLKERDA